MPYYRITIITRSKGKAIGIRESDTSDIDKAWVYFELQTKKKISEADLKFFEVVMLSKRSDEVQNYLQKKRRPPRV